MITRSRWLAFSFAITWFLASSAGLWAQDSKPVAPDPKDKPTMAKKKPEKGSPLAAKMVLKDGLKLKFHRVAKFDCQFVNERKGQSHQLKNSFLMDLTYTIELKKSDSGFQCQFSFTKAHFKYDSQYKDRVRNKEWKSPADMKPLVLLLECDSKGLLSFPKDQKRLGLRSLFSGAGCSSKLAKIPEIYFLQRDQEGLQGSFTYPFSLPEKDSSQWDVVFPSIYGLTDGLLDDFSIMKETWTLSTTKQAKPVKGETTLKAQFKSLNTHGEAFRGLKLNIGKIKSTKGAVVLDADTGIVKSLSVAFEQEYSFETKSGRKGSAGLLKRSETLKRLP